MVFYYQLPSNLIGKIFWNSTNSISSIYEDPNNPLMLNQDYKIIDDILIFLASYLSNRFSDEDIAHYTVVFNTDNYTLTIISFKFTNFGDTKDVTTRLYPNSASDQVFIVVPSETQVQILSNIGQLILNTYVQDQTTLNLWNLKDGTYFVRITGTKFCKTLPLIIKR